MQARQPGPLRIILSLRISGSFSRVFCQQGNDMFSAQGGPVCTWSLICSLVFEVVMMQRYSHLYLLLPSHSLPDLRIFFLLLLFPNIFGGRFGSSGGALAQTESHHIGHHLYHSISPSMPHDASGLPGLVLAPATSLAYPEREVNEWCESTESRTRWEKECRERRQSSQALGS